jgi:uncharacterized protein
MKKEYLKNATIIIILLNVISYIIQLIIPNYTNILILTPQSVLTRPWILITSMFLHGTPTHLLFNMIGLFFFGQLLESRIGTKRFLYIYFGAGLIAAIAASLYYPIIYGVMGQQVRLLGASGGLMGVLGMLVILMPDIKVLIYFVFPLPLWMACLIWVALDTLGIFFPSGTANIAHLAGLAVGLIYGYLLKEKKKKINKKIRYNTHISENEMDEYMYSGRI